MKYCWTVIMVKNLDASIKFYREVLGLMEYMRYPAGSGVEIALMGEGETQVELICNERINEVMIGPDISLGFEAGPLDQMMVRLKRLGIAILRGPYHPNPRQKFLYIMDPNGLEIQLIETIETIKTINK